MTDDGKSRIPGVSISVIIPVRDRFEELRAAVEAILQQTMLPAELIIVDDCSAVPLTRKIIGLDEPPFPVTILRNSTNMGGSRSNNLAASHAAGDVLAFLDSDDVYASAYIEEVQRIWATAAMRPICVAVGFYWCTFQMKPYKVQLKEAMVSRKHLVEHGNIIGGSSVLSVDRLSFLKCGGYPHTKGSHDWGLLLRLSALGPIQVVPIPLVYYRSPVCTRVLTESRQYLRQVRAVFRILNLLQPSEREAGMPNARRLIAMRLALGGRVRMSWRVLGSEMRSHGMPIKPIVAVSFISIFGSKFYEWLRTNQALIRAWIWQWLHRSMLPARTRGAGGS